MMMMMMMIKNFLFQPGGFSPGSTAEHIVSEGLNFVLFDIADKLITIWSCLPDPFQFLILFFKIFFKSAI